jgi:hypothetical protein
MKKAIAGLEPATVAAMLRSGALAIKPQDIGLQSADCPPVWGVVVELGFAAAVASLVVLIDGSVSVYLSDGGGVIGCGLHPEVRDVATQMLKVAQHAVVNCEPTTSHPMPADSQVCFYLLTSGGIVGAQVSKFVLDEGAVELAELYYAAHGLIDIIELLGAGVDLIDEMRLAQSAITTAGREAGNEADANAAASIDISGSPLSEFKARGRACRILPYAGNAARRCRN